MPRSDRLALSGRLALLAVAILSVGANGLFAFTDQAWVLMGTPPEVYPEFLFIFIGLPLALAGLSGAISELWARREKRSGSGLTQLVLWISVASVAISVLLATSIFAPSEVHSPTTATPLDGAIQMVFSGLFLGSPILLLVQLALVAVTIFGSHRS